MTLPVAEIPLPCEMRHTSLSFGPQIAGGRSAPHSTHEDRIKAPMPPQRPALRRTRPEETAFRELCVVSKQTVHNDTTHSTPQQVLRTRNVHPLRRFHASLWQPDSAPLMSRRRIV